MFVGRCLDSGFCVLRSGFCAAVLPSPPATRTDIMETIHAALLEAGSRIAPLASLDEIAGFFQAAAAIGPTAPARATAVAQRLGGSLVDAASMLASILPTLPSMPNVERLLSVLPPCQDMQLGPTRDTCAVCDNGVLEPSQCFTTAPLISAKGLVKQVQLFKRRCSCCHADHYLSYAQAVCAYSEASRCRTRAAPTRATFTSPQAACGRRRSWSTLRRRHSTRTRGSQPSWPSTA